MKGTEKQIKWAEDIRDSIRNDIDLFFDVKFGGTLDSPRAKFALRIWDAIKQIDDAEWFINNRQFDIMRYAETSDGQPKMRKLNNEYPEIAEKIS